MWLPRLLTAVGLTPSNSVARGVIQQRGGAVDGEKFTDPGTKLPAKAGTELILKKSRPCRKARFEENKGWPWPSCIREVLLIHHFTDPFQGR